MEINGVSNKAYTSAAVAAEDDEKLLEEDEQEQKFGVAKPFKEEKDTAKFSVTDFDEDDVEEKANNYLQNILFVGNLTEDSKAAIENYINTFDVAQFIKLYGPFSTAAEVSAAMYAATAGLIKHPEDE